MPRVASRTWEGAGKSQGRQLRVLYAASQVASSRAQIVKRLRVPLIVCQAGVDTVYLVFDFAADHAGQLVDVGAVETAGVREFDGDFLADAAGVGVEDDHAVGEADGFADGVGDEEDRLVGFEPELLELEVEEGAGLGVEGGEGFVHEEDGGVKDEGAGDGDALAHAAGEFVD